MDLLCELSNKELLNKDEVLLYVLLIETSTGISKWRYNMMFLLLRTVCSYITDGNMQLTSNVAAVLTLGLQLAKTRYNIQPEPYSIGPLQLIIAYMSQ